MPQLASPQREGPKKRDELALVSSSDPYGCGLLYKARRAAMFGANLQPTVTTVHHVNLRPGFNIGDELGVLARSAKNAGWLNDFVAFPNCRGSFAGWDNRYRCGLL